MLQLVILAIAMPWLILMAITAPGQLLKRAGRAQVAGG